MKDSHIIKKEMPLVGFNRTTAYGVGTMVLPVMVIGSIILTKFMVIDVYTPYNEILRRPWIHKIRDILSNYPQFIKYQIKEDIKEIKSD